MENGAGLAGSGGGDDAARFEPLHDFRRGEVAEPQPSLEERDRSLPREPDDFDAAGLVGTLHPERKFSGHVRGWRHGMVRRHLPLL